MRQLVELLHGHRHPLTIVTKSALVCRDIDLLSEMAKDNLCSVAVSVTSLDHILSNKLEPKAASPGSRIKIIKALSDAGIPVMVMVAPIIPFLNDNEIESILETVADAGASNAGYVLLRLPHEIKALFKEWLDIHKPLKADHIMSLIRQSRGGKEYNNRYGYRMRGTGQYAELIARRFALAREKYDLNGSWESMSTNLFIKPNLTNLAQMSLWD